MSLLQGSLDRDRRLFLKAAASIASAQLGFGGALTTQASEDSQNTSTPSQLNIGVMGVNGRGAALARGFMGLGNVRISHICDVDSDVAQRVASGLEKDFSTKVQVESDFRRLLDDKHIDAMVVATPNHWHAPATILACAAGKHVYVEKPCSHTPEEGELGILAARKHKRVVTMGSQRRSWPAIQQAIEKIHAGEIGDVHYARCWYNNRRDSIGTGKEVTPPSGLDWDMWQGPAVRQPFRNNVLHYHWHWYWAWGNGELGNNGIHGIDLARWGLNVTYPSRVTAGGGKYRHQDDQQTPDTMMVTFDFPGNKTITWEGLSWSPLGPHKSRFGLSFHGTKGSIVIHDPGYTIFDLQDKEVSTHVDRGGDSDHLRDFVAAIGEGRAANADILEAHRSTLLCHLGNIAYRANSVLITDPNDGHIQNLSAPQAWWSKEYEAGWKPEVV
jgi:predicted dehydrogenase